MKVEVQEEEVIIRMSLAEYVDFVDRIIAAEIGSLMTRVVVRSMLKK